MHCVNHPGVDVQSYCQSCGKPLCAGCVRTTPSGQLMCDSCLATGGADPTQAFWQSYVTPPRGVPNPSAAAALGLIPGVGAMYNGQLFKGLIHVIIFAVLVSITDHYTIFLIFVFAWCLYQSFEAFHTAKARRDGQPVPDPFGLNELGSWLNWSGSSRPPVHPGQSAAPPPPPEAGSTPPAGGGFSQGYGAGYVPEPAEPQAYSAENPGAWGTGYVPPPPNFEPYAGPYARQNPDPYGGSYPPGYIPPVPPDTSARPFGYRGREPIWAFVLIGLGIIFLLQTMGVVSHVIHYAWPILLIGLGVYLIVSRVGYFRGGSK